MGSGRGSRPAPRLDDGRGASGRGSRWLGLGGDGGNAYGEAVARPQATAGAGTCVDRGAGGTWEPCCVRSWRPRPLQGGGEYPRLLAERRGWGTGRRSRPSTGKPRDMGKGRQRRQSRKNGNAYVERRAGEGRAPWPGWMIIRSASWYGGCRPNWTAGGRVPRRRSGRPVFNLAPRSGAPVHAWKRLLTRGCLDRRDLNKAMAGDDPDLALARGGLPGQTAYRPSRKPASPGWPKHAGDELQGQRAPLVFLVFSTIADRVVQAVPSWPWSRLLEVRFLAALLSCPPMRRADRMKSIVPTHYFASPRQERPSRVLVWPDRRPSR